MSGVTLALWLPIVVTIIGWFFIAQQAAKREFRKEVRDRVGELRVAADAADLACEEYWLESVRSKWPRAGVRLKAAIKRLANRVAILEAAGLSFDGATLMAAIRKEATQEPFESAKRRKNSANDSDRVHETSSLIQDLVYEAELAFYRDFPPVTAKKRSRWALPFAAAGFLSSDSSDAA